MCVVQSYVCKYKNTCVSTDMTNVEWLTHLCWLLSTGTNEDFCTTLGGLQRCYFTDWDDLRSAKTDRNRDTTHVYNMRIFFPVESSCLFLSAMSKPKWCLCSDTHMPNVLLVNIAQTSHIQNNMCKFLEVTCSLNDERSVPYVLPLYVKIDL